MPIAFTSAVQVVVNGERCIQFVYTDLQGRTHTVLLDEGMYEIIKAVAAAAI